jgi:uncharacterized membrane protein
MSIILASTFASCMAGLIWFVQIVHYPLFHTVQDETFKVYERKHQQLTGYVVLPLMIAELITSITLFLQEPHALWNQVQLALLAVNWLSTFFIQMPLHGKLSQGKNDQAILLLVRTNWLRTVCWTARSVIFAGVLLS